VSIYHITSNHVHCKIRRSLYSLTLTDDSLSVYIVIQGRPVDVVRRAWLSVTSLKDATCRHEGSVSANFRQYQRIAARAYTYYNIILDSWHRLLNDDNSDARAQCDCIISCTKAIGNRKKEKKNQNSSSIMCMHTLTLYVEFGEHNNNNNIYSVWLSVVEVVRILCWRYYILPYSSRNPFVYIYTYISVITSYDFM